MFSHSPGDDRADTEVKKRMKGRGALQAGHCGRKGKGETGRELRAEREDGGHKGIR